MRGEMFLVWGVEGAEELEVVAEAGVEGEVGGDAPLVLDVEADVGIGLGDGWGAEGLGVALGVVVTAQEAVRATALSNGRGSRAIKAGEGVGSAEGLGEGDGVAVIEEVDAGLEGAWAALEDEVVDGFVEVVEAGDGRGGEAAEGGDAGDGDGRADVVVGGGVEAVVGELGAGFVEGAG